MEVEVSKKPEWIQAGTWCIFEFKIGQVKQVEPYFAFSDGMCETSGQLWERIVPLTLENIAIMWHYEYYSDRLHKEGVNGLNYPDIHRWLSEHWYVTTTQRPTKDNEKVEREWFDQRYKELGEFFAEMLAEGKETTRWGFPAMRPR